MLFDRLIVYHDCERPSAAMNMAVDEAIFESATVPSLRFYHWARPAISFGYFGRIAEVEAEANGREVVRRWTGGGSVPHGDDLTYALVTPATDAASHQGPPTIYAALHTAIRDALRTQNRSAELAATAAEKISDACFANPVQFDVILEGRKIAGAAQRRTRRGFLHQGSIQLPGLSLEFGERFARLLASEIEVRAIPLEVVERAARLAEEKYGTENWLRRW